MSQVKQKLLSVVSYLSEPPDLLQYLSPRLEPVSLAKAWLNPLDPPDPPDPSDFNDSSRQPTTNSHLVFTISRQQISLDLPSSPFASSEIGPEKSSTTTGGTTPLAPSNMSADFPFTVPSVFLLVTTSCVLGEVGLAHQVGFVFLWCPMKKYKCPTTITRL